MSHERSHNRSRRFLASGIRSLLGSRSPSPVAQHPPSPHSSHHLDIPPNTHPSNSTPQTKYLHVNSVQPTPRISPSVSFRESTCQSPGPSVDHQANYPAYSHLPHPQNQSAPLNQPNNPLECEPSHRGPTPIRGMFSQPSHFTITGGEFNDYSNTDNFMEKLLKETIPGAEFDSSDRDPPPRCHPGTRITVIKRCKYFVINCQGKQKMRWVVGAAGVGKTAIMQSIAEDPPPEVPVGASVFFAVNGRDDGRKTITTIAYQLAAKCEPYRRFIQAEVTRDPTLLTKSIPAQFERLIVKPFIHQQLLDPSGRFLILIDGLDECNKREVQQQLLRLILDFCTNHPRSPLIWIVASRPERHITSILDEDNVKTICEREEISVDMDQAREDAEQFLRDRLNDIKGETISLKHLQRWPLEHEFLQIAQAAGGLMVYASTVVRYIGDLESGDPSSRLSNVLKTINATLDSQMHNPMAQLDALYLRIMTSRPEGITGNTRKLLVMLAGGFDECFAFECNFLAMTMEEAYSATNHFPSVVDIPDPDKAHSDNLRSFHKSFIDYLSDYTRSEFSRDIKREYQELVAEYSFRILDEALHGVDTDGNYDLAEGGTLIRSPGSGHNISLNWTAGDPDENHTRHRMYTLAVTNVIHGVGNEETPFQCISSINALTSRFDTYCASFPYFALNDLVFGAQCHEFLEHGILKQVPLNKIHIPGMKYYLLRSRYHCLATEAKKPKLIRYSSCKHQWVGRCDEDPERDWITQFSEWPERPWYTCAFCCQHFEYHLERWKTHSPDHLITFLSSSTGTNWVEIRFIDPEDGVSEWFYWFLLFTPLGESGSSPDQLPIAPLSSTLPNSQGQSHDTLAPSSRNVFSITVSDAIRYNLRNSDPFMEQLLNETIPGPVAYPFDLVYTKSVHRNLIGRCRYFVINYNSKKRLLWLVGRSVDSHTGLFRSVFMDTPLSGAMISFTAAGSGDGTKAIKSIAYQLAVKLLCYRFFIEQEVTHDPSLLQKSLSIQFERLIIEPFIRRGLVDSQSRFFITIDNLTMCDDPCTQQELLSLVSDFCITYPTSPLVWIISSYPEPHIRSFFSQPKIARSSQKEEVLDERDEDVEQFLRDRFVKIQRASFKLRRHRRWPSDGDLIKIIEASNGVLEYASVVIRYIDDPFYEDPVGQLTDILGIIEAGLNVDISRERGPFSSLDALYTLIMSKIPHQQKADARKLLLLYTSDFARNVPFRNGCDMLGMSKGIAYAATRHIGAIAAVATPGEAADTPLRFFHESFCDYLRDYNRSGFSPDLTSEARQLLGQCALRIIQEALDGAPTGGVSQNRFLQSSYGTLKNGSGTDDISIAWPAVGGGNNRKIQAKIFRRALMVVMEGLERGEEVFQSLLCLRVLATSFDKLPTSFPRDAFQDLIYDDSRRHELFSHGILKESTLEAIQKDDEWDYAFQRLCFRSPTLCDPWNASCEHERKGNWEGPGQDWSTNLVSSYTSEACFHCVQRFEQHSKMLSPNHLLTVCGLTPTDAIAQLHFVDPGDGVSEWTYHFSVRRDPESESESESGSIIYSYLPFERATRNTRARRGLFSRVEPASTSFSASSPRRVE